MSERKAADLAVDVVIDNYNYGAFLGEAIESACRQTHENVHVVVVDDGSTDDSREVLRGYADEVTVVLKENGGQASALNAGMERCRGDVVIFLDADDVLHPEAAARAAAAFADDAGLAKAQSRMDTIDAEGRPLGGIKPEQTRAIVVLPAPFEPSNASTRPRSSENDTPKIARNGP